MRQSAVRLKCFRTGSSLFQYVIIQWGRRPAFAGNFGGDALKDFRFGARVNQQIQFGLAEHIDETGSYDHAARVEDSFVDVRDDVTAR